MLTFMQLGRLGRVGNAMFQIASIIGISTRLGYSYGFPDWKNHDHRNLFHSNEDIDIQKYFLTPLPGIDPNARFDQWDIPWGYHEIIVPDRNLSLAGHMQSERYFSHCQELIRRYFAFNPDAYTGPKIEGIDKACGIHIRRGDYDNKYHPFCPEQYYEEAMALFPPGTRWIVFSDDIPQARALIGGRAEYVEGLHYMEDMYLMSQCSDLIISNSTFSWWGAWLIANPGKQIVSPSADSWFGPVAGITAADIIPESWVQLHY